MHSRRKEGKKEYITRVMMNDGRSDDGDGGVGGAGGVGNGDVWFFLLYPLIFFDISFPTRTFLRELENCADNPELVGTCFLKRVS